MEVPPWPSRIASQDLGKAVPFVLGARSVDPPTLKLTRGTSAAVLDPRVMQVLVALAGSAGKVLSRDDLIALCRDGRIVGDNAINLVEAILGRDPKPAKRGPKATAKGIECTVAVILSP